MDPFSRYLIALHLAFTMPTAPPAIFSPPGVSSPSAPGAVHAVPSPNPATPAVIHAPPMASLASGWAVSGLEDAELNQTLIPGSGDLFGLWGRCLSGGDWWSSNGASSGSGKWMALYQESMITPSASTLSAIFPPDNYFAGTYDALVDARDGFGTSEDYGDGVSIGGGTDYVCVDGRFAERTLNAVTYVAKTIGTAAHAVSVAHAAAAAGTGTTVGVAGNAITITPGQKARMTVGGSLTNSGSPVTFSVLEYTGQVNAKPRYAAGTSYVSWDGSKWQLVHDDTGPVWQSTDAVASPDLVTTWTAVGSAGGTPTVTATVSSAAQVVAAVEASGPASALVAAKASAAETDTVTTATAANLSGGLEPGNGACWIDYYDTTNQAADSVAVAGGSAILIRLSNYRAEIGFQGGLGATWYDSPATTFVWKLQQLSDGSHAFQGAWTGSGTSPATAAWNTSVFKPGTLVLTAVAGGLSVPPSIHAAPNRNPGMPPAITP